MVFITIEGIDGSGKTTQAKFLYKKLSSLGYPAILEKEPTDGAIGKFIKGVLSGKEPMGAISLQLLFAADRSEHLRAIENLLKSSVVISDRYYYSTIAYGEAIGIKREYLENVNSIFPKPDKTFILEISPETALARLKNRSNDSEIFENLETLLKVKSAYDKFSGQEIERVNAEAGMAEISNVLISKTLGFLDSAGVKAQVNGGAHAD